MKIDATKVKHLRTGKNWSQEQLGLTCGLSLRTIQRLETTGKASIESVRALADAFEVDPSTLLLIEKANAPMTPLDAVKSGFINFSDFSGTATRFEYGWFFAFVLLVTALATIVGQTASQIMSVILLLPFLAVGTRRLNETGQSGWWQLLWLVPFGQFVVFYMLMRGRAVPAAKVSQDKLDTVF